MNNEANRPGVPARFIAAGVVTAGMGVLGFFIPVIANIERDMKPVAQAVPTEQMVSPTNG